MKYLTAVITLTTKVQDDDKDEVDGFHCYAGLITEQIAGFSPYEAQCEFSEEEG